MLNKLIQLILPKCCVNCGEEGDYLCYQCRKDIKSHPEICPLCNEKFYDFQICPNCKKLYSYLLDGIIIGFQYTQFIKKLILKFKYQHVYDLGDFFAQRLMYTIISNQTLFQQLQSYTTYFTSVPSHWFKKYFIRGYNQSEILAKQLALKLNLAYVDIISKTKYTSTQTKHKRIERFSNLIGSFDIDHNITLKGDELIIIVDDIITTGSTILSVSKTIKNAYPNMKIWGIVIGRHCN